MRTTIHVGFHSYYSSVTKEIHILGFKRFRIRRMSGNNEQVLDLDFRNSKLKDYKAKNIGDTNIRSVRVNKNHITMSYIGAIATGNEPDIRIYDYMGPYPKLVYLANGETESTPQEMAVNPGTVPHWIERESAAVREARERAEHLTDWTRYIHKIAREHFETDLTPALAKIFGKSVDITPNLFSNFDTRNAHHRKSQKTANICVDRLRLIGMGWRLIKLYESSDNAVPFELKRDAEWKSGVVYGAGNYEKYNGATWWCLKEHTSADANKPGLSESADIWRQVFLNGIPSSFVHNHVSYTHDQEENTYVKAVTAKNITINLEDGTGIEDYLHMLAQEFSYHDDHPSNHRSGIRQDAEPQDSIYKFFGILQKLDEWQKKRNKWELWTSKIESTDPIAIIPDTKVYCAEVQPVSRSNSLHIRDSAELTEADWVNLLGGYFEALSHHVHEEAESVFSRSPGY